MRYASTTVLATLLLVTAARATEATTDAPVLSTEILEIWNQTYDPASADTKVSEYDFNTEYGFDAAEPVQSVNGYARPNGNSLTPNFDRLIAHYGSQGSAVAASRTAMPTAAPMALGSSSAGQAWKGGSAPGSTGPTLSSKPDKKDDPTPPGGGNNQGGNNQGGNNQGGNNQGGNTNPDCPAPTPEPGTLLLMGVAAGAASLKARRKRNRS